MKEKSMSKPKEITLRPFQISDVDDFLTWAGDDDVAQHCQWNAYTNRDDASTFLRQVIDSHPWYKAICVDDRPIGSIYVMPETTTRDQRRGEIGYAVSAKHWGQGIATQAVKLAVSSVFKDLECLDRVQGLVLPENKASQRVLEKAGFFQRGSSQKVCLCQGKK